ncbi:MAG: hypothetical protein ACFFG0_09610 [Candidatus Thorarchaeota archaeon]
MEDKQKKKYKAVQVNLTEKTVEIIDRAVELGYGNSRADFGAMAILSKLEELGLFNVEIQKLLMESKSEREG